jgi:hypothetical protein
VYRLQCADEPLIDAAGNFWYGNKSPVLASSGVVNVQHGETIQTAGGADSVPQTVYKSECYFKTSTTLRLPGEPTGPSLPPASVSMGSLQPMQKWHRLARSGACMPCLLDDRLRLLRGLDR